MNRSFPFEFEAQKPLEIFPEKDLSEKTPADILEIGPGRGDVLLSLAEKNPEKQFVAIEIGNKRFEKLVSRIQKKQLTNILLFRGDARTTLPRFFNENTFEKIFVLFPDPWPKTRHTFRRLLQKDFLCLLTHVLKPGGHFILGTDVPEYASWVFRNLSQIPDLQNTLDTPWVSSLEELPMTFFEKKWRDMGRTIHFLKWKKV